MTSPSPRRVGRRPKCTEARSRGVKGTDSAAALYLAPIDGRWPIHALPRTPLSRLVRPAQRAVTQRLRALARHGHDRRQPERVRFRGDTGGAVFEMPAP
jgi:hypothetical protein